MRPPCFSKAILYYDAPLPSTGSAGAAFPSVLSTIRALRLPAPITESLIFSLLRSHRSSPGSLPCGGDFRTGLAPFKPGTAGYCRQVEHRLGRTMARTGLRMMPTFPLSPLRFRTAGFPRYGSKAGVSDRAFPNPDQVKPAPGVPFTRSKFTSVLRAPQSQRSRRRSEPAASCAFKHHHSSDHRRSAPGALAPVRVIVSRSIATYPAPSAPLAGTSQLHRPAAYMRCLRCAGAPRRPASGSALSLAIPSQHVVLTVPGEPVAAYTQFLRDERLPSPRDPNGSALPI